MPDFDKSKVTLGVASAIFAFLFIQGGVAIWWAATMSSDMKNVKEMLAINTIQQKRDFDNLATRIGVNEAAIRKIEGEDRYQLRLEITHLKSKIEQLEKVK
jgi:hypothetical protein